jgi:hypothetical protein
MRLIAALVFVVGLVTVGDWFLNLGIGWKLVVGAVVVVLVSIYNRTRAGAQKHR